MTNNKTLTKILYLLYRKLRVPIGIPMAFVLMFSSYTGTLSLTVILAAIAFAATELFGYFYNDYWDFEEDKRNNRKDKFTTLGMLNKKQMLMVAVSIALVSLVILFLTNLFILLLGLYYLIVTASYSHPKIKLKGSVKGYAIYSSVFFLFPFALSATSSVPLQHVILFSVLFFCQSLYILLQKDSTDLKDDRNIFLKHKWANATYFVMFFAALSSLALLLLSLNSLIFLLFWFINLFSKSINSYKIYTRTISRATRSNLILIEFITPYLFFLAVVL